MRLFPINNNFLHRGLQNWIDSIEEGAMQEIKIAKGTKPEDFLGGDELIILNLLKQIVEILARD